MEHDELRVVQSPGSGDSLASLSLTVIRGYSIVAIRSKDTVQIIIVCFTKPSIAGARLSPAGSAMPSLRRADRKHPVFK